MASLGVVILGVSPFAGVLTIGVFTDLLLFSLGVLTSLVGDSRIASLGVVILGVAPLAGVFTIGVLGTDFDLEVSGVFATSFFCLFVELFGAGGEMEVFLFADLDGVDSGTSTFLGDVVG